MHTRRDCMQTFATNANMHLRHMPNGCAIFGFRKRRLTLVSDSHGPLAMVFGGACIIVRMRWARHQFRPWTGLPPLFRLRGRHKQRQARPRQQHVGHRRRSCPDARLTITLFVLARKQIDTEDRLGSGVHCASWRRGTSTTNAIEELLTQRICDVDSFWKHLVADLKVEEYKKCMGSPSVVHLFGHHKNQHRLLHSIIAKRMLQFAQSKCATQQDFFSGSVPKQSPSTIFLICTIL